MYRTKPERSQHEIRKMWRIRLVKLTWKSTRCRLKFLITTPDKCDFKHIRDRNTTNHSPTRIIISMYVHNTVMSS